MLSAGRARAFMANHARFSRERVTGGSVFEAAAEVKEDEDERCESAALLPSVPAELELEVAPALAL